MKSTEELISEIEEAEDIGQYLVLNQKLLVQESLNSFLGKQLSVYKRKQKEVIACSGLNITYAYQIFDGKKQPKRDKIIQLAFGFPMKLADIQQMLEYGGYNRLSPCVRRDAIIIYAVVHGLSIDTLNGLLGEYGETEFEMY